MKCTREPIDELTVQIWKLYHDLNLSYCTLFVSGMELWTDIWTMQLLDATGGPFRPGELKIVFYYYMDFAGFGN